MRLHIAPPDFKLFVGEIVPLPRQPIGNGFLIQKIVPISSVFVVNQTKKLKIDLLSVVFLSSAWLIICICWMLIGYFVAQFVCISKYTLISFREVYEKFSALL